MGGPSTLKNRGGPTSPSSLGKFNANKSSSSSSRGGSRVASLLERVCNGSFVLGMLSVLCPIGLYHAPLHQVKPWAKKIGEKAACMLLGRNCDPTAKWLRIVPHSKDPKIGNMAKWLKNECRATGLDNVFIGEFPKGPEGQLVRGLGFSRAIKKDTLFVCIPKKCWLGEPNLPKRYAALKKKHAPQCDTIQYVMALWMADEFRKGEKSFWKPYLDTIPTKSEYEMYHPAFWKSSGERFYKQCVDANGGNAANCKQPWDAEGDGSHLWNLWYGWVQDCYQKYSQEFDAGNFKVPSDEPGAELLQTKLTPEEVNFGYVLTMTRDFEGVGNLPLIDMPNTEEEYNSHQYWYDERKSMFCLLNEKPVAKGEEVNVNYAQNTKNPFMMFAQYGFALEPKYHSEYTHSTARCQGLQDGDKVHELQNPVAENFSNFAKRYCSTEEMERMRVEEYGEGTGAENGPNDAAMADL
ncbi:unnamed protein product [Amoebophrya sp. A120]|nr:unnamed protein product [Amoebophrya sp. A120]|eukprot:GSA120T00001435001.1